MISRTLEEPLTWENSTLIAEDALDAVPRLKAESPVSLRSYGSIAMNRALLAAGLVDRLEVMVFPVIRPITDEGVAVSGAFDSDMAVGMMPIAHSRRRCASILAIVTRRQEVRPMNAVSAVGAPLQSTIARLR